MVVETTQVRGDAISFRLHALRDNAEGLQKRLKERRLTRKQLKRLDKRLEDVSLEARLLWRIRENMLGINRGQRWPYS